MKIITAKNLKKRINEYAVNTEIKKNEFVHIHYRAIYSARIFGICIIRNMKLWSTFSK